MSRQLKALQIALFLLFSAIYGLLVFHHVLWRDEALPIQLVQNNPGFGDFAHAMRYEGIPGAWHFALWITAKLVPLTPFSAACIHYLFVEGFIAVALFLLPIPLVYRISILLLEPSIWNAFNIRQYQITAFCILLFAAFYRRNASRVRIPILCGALALLAQTNVHSIPIALALFAFFFVDVWKAERRWNHWYWLVFISIALAVAQLSTPPDLIRGMGGWHTEVSWKRAWDTFKTATTLILLDRSLLMLGFGIFIFVIFQQAWRERKTGCLLALVMLAGLYMIFYVVGYGKFSGPRHYWMLTYTIIAFLIMLSPRIDAKWYSPKVALITQYACLLLTAWYFLQITPDAIFALKSQCKNVAAFLDTHFPAKTVLSKSEVYEAPVRLYRRTHPPEFALGRQAFVKYTVWNDFSIDFAYNPKAQHITLSDTRADLLRTDAAILDNEPVVILSGVEIKDDLPHRPDGSITIGDRYQLTPVALFEGSMNENYRVYLLRKMN